MANVMDVSIRSPVSATVTFDASHVQPPATLRSRVNIHNLKPMNLPPLRRNPMRNIRHRLLIRRLTPLLVQRLHRVPIYIPVMTPVVLWERVEERRALVRDGRRA